MSKKMRAYILNILAITAIFLVINLMIDAKILSRSNRSMLMDVGIAIIMATSLNLTTGMLGQLALGHAGFMAIGAYTAALVTKHMTVDIALSFPLGLIAGGLVAAVFGIIIGVPALRLKGDYLAIITLGFGEIIRVIINNLPFTGGAMGLIGINRATTFSYVYVVMVLIVISLFTLGRSRHGRAIISIRENEVAAESTGIPTTRYKIFAFTLAAFFAGIAGGLYAHKMGTLSPATFDFNKSIEYLVMVVLGGMGSLTGSIVAATVLTMLPELLRFLADWRMLIYSIVLILMMLFRPKGLLGTLEFSLVEVWDFCAKYVKKAFAFIKKHLPKREQKVIMPEVPKYDYANFNLPVLETDKLGIRFGGLQAAQDVHIKLYDNEIVGLIGPNGAGKTTVFNMLTGVYLPTEGDIMLLGKSIVGKATHEITANGIARTFQNIRLFKSMTVLENIKVAFQTRMHYSVLDGVLRTSRFNREEMGIDLRARELLSVFGMENVADVRADSLPYGQQRKLEICRALASNPKVLLLDEPAAGMNPIETEELMKTIRTIRERFSVAVLLIEHDMKLVMGICERIYVLNYGRILAQGTPEEIATNSEVVEAYLGKSENTEREK
ncbi:MAG: branched-chain amino acid ABC transporter ATP-binding protein/permease [Clostridia bacterium]|nr:branched-chain amino acid ABC transporter ATP-binding protein/permease [Clostridia bacterium]